MTYLPPFVNNPKGRGRTFSAPQPDQSEAAPPANVDEAVAAKEKEPEMLFVEPEVAAAAESPKLKTPKKSKKPPAQGQE